MSKLKMASYSKMPWESCIAMTKYLCIGYQIVICNICSFYEEDEATNGWIAGKAAMDIACKTTTGSTSSRRENKSAEQTVEEPTVSKKRIKGKHNMATTDNNIMCVLNAELNSALFKRDRESLKLAVLKIGNHYFEIRSFKNAKIQFEKLLCIALNDSADSLMLHCYSILGPILVELREFDLALECCAQGFENARDLEDTHNLRCMLRCIGNCFNQLDMLKKAERCYKDCLVITSSITYVNVVHPLLKEMHGKESIFNQQESPGNFESLVGILAVTRERGYREFKPRILTDFAVVARKLGQYEEGIKYCKESMRIYPKELKSLCSLGKLYQAKGDFEDAVEVFQRSLKIAIDEKDRSCEGRICVDLQLAYMSLKQNSEANKYGQRALEIAREIKDLRMECQASSNLSESYRSSGHAEEARQQLKTSQELSKIVKITPREFCCLNYKSIFGLPLKKTARVDLGRKIQEAKNYGDMKTELALCLSAGQQCYLHFEFKKSLAYSNRAITISKVTKDLAMQLFAQLCLAGVLNKLKKRQEAIEISEDLLSQVHLLESPLQGACTIEAHINMMVSYMEMKEMDKGHYHFDKALNMVEETKDKEHEQSLYFELFNAYGYLGMFEKCLLTAEKVFKILEYTKSFQMESKICLQVSNIHYCLGRYKDAIEFAKRGLVVAEKHEFDYLKGQAYNQLGLVSCAVGDCDKQSRYYQKALAIAKKCGDAKALCSAYDGLLEYYNKKNLVEKAFETAEHFLTTAREEGLKDSEVMALYRIASLNLSQGKKEKAESILMQAIAINDNSQLQACFYSTLGHISTNVFKRWDYYERALNNAKEYSEKKDLMICYNNLKRFADFSQAIFKDGVLKIKFQKLRQGYATKSLECNESFFNSLEKIDSSRISIFESLIKDYQDMTRFLIEEKKTNDALLVSEKGRSCVLREILLMRYDMETKEMKNVDINNILAIATKKKMSIVFYAMLDSSIAAWIISENGVFFQEIKEFKLDYTKIAKPKAKFDYRESIGGILGSLDSKMNRRKGDLRHATMESDHIECCDEDLLTIPNRQRGYVEDIGEDEEEINWHDIDTMAVLYEWLILPIKDKFIGEELVIVPEGMMFMIPFSALRNPSSGLHLHELMPVRIVPSLVSLEVLHNVDESYHGNSGALVVGASKVKFKEYKDLPFAEEEAKAVAALLKVEPVVGHSATKMKIKERLAQDHAVIHIAAHGELIGKIVLAADASSLPDYVPMTKECVLTMAEVQKIGVRAKLVVLSCCNSGGGELKAEGVIGLARAFLIAGAKAVIAALWIIPDNATAVFMEMLYKHLVKGKSASVSLNEAVKEMKAIEKYRKPEYWAPFFLLGDNVVIQNSG